MKPAAVRRILGLAAGTALVGAGALEIGVARSDFESAGTQVFCRAGLCADQFAVERVFQDSQKATLGDARGQLEDFKRGVVLSPGSAYRWADLGEAEFNVRDFKEGDYAFVQALKAGPRSSVILMRAANYYFQTGDERQVVPKLVALLNDPWSQDYYETAFLTYSRLGLPANEILSQVPQTKPVMSRLLTFWTKTNKADDAVAAWKWADERSLADNQSTGDFFAFLVKTGRQSTAQQLWQDYAKKREPEYRKSNWVYNPSFENKPQLSPFDWTINARQDVEADRVQDVTRNGKWAFRIRFNGEANITYHQTYQDMVLPPGRYKFSVMMKAEQVTTDEGVRLHIFDQPSQSRMNEWTDTVLGTQDWRLIEKSFEVPAGLDLVRVEIGRLSSPMADNKIGGTTWIDEIRLARQ